ncbi:MAG TPA: SBBP repeat-containing protein [Bryobacteraceae bacterium]|nr:SBBP repeat-containing protein [Bryobacteraceae bacterium]
MLLLWLSIFSLAALAAPPVSEYPAAHAAPGETPAALAVDSEGYTYLAGTVARAAGQAFTGLYVTKIDPSGQSRIYTAYLSGSGLQRVTAVAVDAMGNAYIAGYTSSTDFPVIGGVQKTPGGRLDAFVAKLDPKGAQWLYATYLGGAGDDVANGIAVDPQGNAYVTGRTNSSNFPLHNAAQAEKAGDSDGFLAEIGADGSTLLYASYLGGGLRTSGSAIALDSGGAVWLAGSVAGSPPSGASGLIAAPGEDIQQAFLLKMAVDGSKPESIRTLGTTGQQEATSLAVDQADAVYITGWTDSPDFPVTVGSGEVRGRAVFAAKFAADGSQVYSTLIAGAEGDIAPSITADSMGNAYVGAASRGAQGHPGERSGLLVKLSSGAERQLASETVPGVAASHGMALAAAGSGRAIVAGAGIAGQPYAASVSTCGFRVSAAAQTVGSQGGAGTLTVETSPECDWQAESRVPWVELSGAGAGSGKLSYRLAANSGASRTAALAIGGETVTLTQAGGTGSRFAAASSGALRDNPGFRSVPLQSCDDCSAAESVDLGFSIDFYGRTYTQAWVNANGNITLDGPDGSYTPLPLAGLRNARIAPFWADVDTRSAAPGAIGYGRDVVNGHAAFGVNWSSVGYYAGHQDKLNSFQLVLIDRSDIAAGAFDIEMNYGSLQWEAGNASGRTTARAGFTNGTGAPGTFLELPGSGTKGALLDGGADSLAGRHTFSIRPAETVTEAPAAAIGTLQPLTSGGSAGSVMLACDTNGVLYSIAPTTGVTTTIGAMPAVMGNLASFNGVVYGVSYSPSSPSNLYIINPGNASGVLIGNTGVYLNGIAFNSSGTLYAIGGVGSYSATNNLYTVNTSTGALTLVGASNLADAIQFNNTGQLYMADQSTPDTVLDSINPASGQATPIGSSTGFSEIGGLAFVQGTMYGITASGQVVSINLTTGVGTQVSTGTATGGAEFYGATAYTPNTTPTNVVLACDTLANLYSVTPSTGATTLIGTTAIVMGNLAAFNGVLYGVSYSTTSPSGLYLINPNTAAATLIGNTGTYLNGIAFNSAGVLYAVGSPTSYTSTNNLYTVNTATGALTLVGSGTTSYVADAIQFDNTGKLYLVDGSNPHLLYSIAPASGQATEIGSTNFSSVSGLAFLLGTMYGVSESGQVLSINLTTGAGTQVSTSSLGAVSFFGATAYTSSTAPALSITKSHAGNFVNGEQGTYTVTVSNAAGAPATSGTVAVTENLPSGLTLVSMSGSGWNCPGKNSCTRSDPLSGGAAYPSLTVTVTVAGAAPSPQVNSVSVSGGGSATASTTDSTTITKVGALITCTSSPLSFSYTIGGASPAAESCSITSTPSGSAVTASAITASGGDWLFVSPGSGTTPETLTVSVSALGLPANTYGGTVQLVVGGQSYPLAVSLTVISTQVDFSLAAQSPSPASFSGAAGSGTALLTLSPSGSTTAWSIASTASWLHVTSPASDAGSGAATIDYSVDANTGPARFGSLNVSSGGDVVATLTVNQAAVGCAGLTVSPTSFTFGSSGGSGVLNFNIAGCSWTASTTDSTLVTGLPTSGTSGTISFGVAAGATAASANIGIPSTSPATTITVTRAAPVCTYTLSTPGAIGTSNSFLSGGGSGSVNVTAPAGCSWTTSSNASFLHVTGGATGSGNGSASYSVDSNSAPTGSPSRSGTLTVAGITYTITQAPQGPYGYNCSTSVAAPATMRTEGIAELAADIVLNCSGYSAGNVTGDVLVTLNTWLTNHTLNSDPSGQTTDALLLVDEPAGNNLILSGTKQNVYRGIVSGPMSVTFKSVSLAPENGNFSHIFRITNVRADANYLSGSAITAAVSTISAAPFSISGASQTVGLPQGSSSFSVGSSAPAPLGESLPISFTENFANAYRVRLASGQDPSSVGVVYNSESGYVNSAVLGSDTGFATNGTRLVAQFANIPSGVSIYVPVTQSYFAEGEGNIPETTTFNLATAQLVSADSTGTGGSPMQGSALVPGYQPVALVNGAGTATWEVTGSSSTAIDNLTFDLLIGSPSLTLQNSCGGGTQPSVCGAIGPQVAVSAPSNTAPVPHFATPTVSGPPVSPPKIRLALTTANAVTSGVSGSCSSSGATVTVGGTITPTLTLTSDVTSPTASGVDAGVTLPPSFTITQCTATQGTCGAGGSNSIPVTYPSTFDAGQTSNISLVADTCSPSGSAEVDANVTSDSGNAGGGSFTQGVTIYPGASIQLSFQGPPSVAPGQPITYTVGLGNNPAFGSKVAGDPLTVTINLDSDVTGVTNNADSTWQCSQTNATTLVCTNKSAIEAGTGADDFQVMGTMSPSATVGETLSTYATLTFGGMTSAPQSPNTVVGSALPAAPVLSSPANGTTGVSTSASLNWSTATGANTYTVYFGTVNPPPVVIQSTILTTYSPSLIQGTTYYWYIAATNSSGSTPSAAVWSFTTGAAPGTVTLSPASGSTNISTSVSLGWSSTGATSYAVNFGTTNPPPQVVPSTTATNYSPANLAASTTYYWQIVATNSFGSTSSSIASFTTAAPGVLTLISPTNGATGVSTSASLTWSLSTPATSYAVYFGIANPPPLVVPNTTSTTYTPPTLTAGTTYYWQVIASTSTGTDSSTVASFTTGAPPGAVISPSPANGATGVSQSTSLSWSAATGATAYNVYFGATNQPPLVGQGTTLNDFPLQTLASGTTYYWQVVATNSFGSTSSPVWSFTTGPITGGCQFTLNGGNAASLPSAGTATVSAAYPGGVAPEIPVTVTIAPGSGCSSSYTAVSSATWLTATVNANSFTYTALSNAHPSSRSATLAVANASGGSQTFTVTEAGDTEILQNRQVRALYQSMLGRDPDPSGFTFWTGSGAASLGQMGDDFLTSPEAFNSDFAVMATYQATTGAVPGYAAFTSAVGAIRANTETIAQLFVALISANPSYSAATLYQNLLNRAPTASEIASAGTTPAALAAWFEALIGYPSSITPVGAPNNEFQSTGTFHAPLAGCPTCGVDHTNGLYIAMLYYTILGRDLDVSGYDFWLGVANSGGPGIAFQGAAGYPTRIQILGPGTPNQGFIGSPEFQGLYQ